MLRSMAIRDLSTKLEKTEVRYVASFEAVEEVLT